MNSNLISLIDALRTDRAGDAQSAFERAMSEKVNAALDERKVAVASQIYNSAIAEGVEASEDEDEDEIDDAGEDQDTDNSEDSDETVQEAAVDAKGHKSSTGGLTQKGRDHYNRKSGGNLKAPVTTPPSKLKKGSKPYNRRKSFCARMGGVKGPMKKPNGEPTRKALALKKWNC